MQIEVKGVDRILKQLERFDNMETKLADIAQRLVAVGEPIIRAVHGNHNAVWSEPTAEGYRIVAEGESVLFIEFGTGNATGMGSSGKYDDIPVVVYPGSWSEAHQGEYWRTGGYPNGYWHFGGKVIRETPPHPAFYDAYKAMVEALPQIVEEVFR